jgi:hypothetical protein
MSDRIADIVGIAMAVLAIGGFIAVCIIAVIIVMALAGVVL